MGISDEAWIAAARSRVERGEDWETPDSALFYPGPVATAVARPEGLHCPYCAGHPPLQVYPSTEFVTAEPLWFCGTCYGFWAPAGAMASGFRADSGDPDPILARQAPARCRACMGHLDENQVCRKCGTRLPRLSCPSCGQLMARTMQKGITIDECTACRHSWFDTGEIAAVYNLTPPRTLAEQQTETLPHQEMSPWMFAFDIVLRLLPLLG